MTRRTIIIKLVMPPSVSCELRMDLSSESSISYSTNNFAINDPSPLPPHSSIFNGLNHNENCNYFTSSDHSRCSCSSYCCNKNIQEEVLLLLQLLHFDLQVHQQWILEQDTRKRQKKRRRVGRVCWWASVVVLKLELLESSVSKSSSASTSVSSFLLRKFPRRILSPLLNLTRLFSGKEWCHHRHHHLNPFRHFSQSVSYSLHWLSQKKKEEEGNRRRRSCLNLEDGPLTVLQLVVDQ